MNQVADILKLAAQAKQQNIDAVLATVVRTEGSAYRHAGAMMLICADGRSVGMISGGCLEPHIIKRAFWLTRNGANIQVYQTGDEQRDDETDELDIDSDDELNFGLGCNGKVHVLFERLTSAKPFLELISQVRKDQQPITVATLIRSDSSKLHIGTRINIDNYSNLKKSSDKQLTIEKTAIINSNDSNLTTLSFENIPQQVLYELSAYNFDKKNTEYLVLNNNVKRETLKSEWLLQRLQPQIRLLICGAGNDVMPLVTMAKLQDWNVTIIDSRPQYATRARFPQADEVMCLALDDTDTLIKLSANAAVAVMSHSLAQDRARLTVLLEQASFSYLGQLGPRYRTERLINEISATMANPAVLAEGISRLQYPIGYKLGGDGPEALALSIMAQISAVIHGQTQSVTSPNNQHLLQSAIEHNYINDYAHD